ncbi:hypothetical protein [Haloferula sp.]|uniref:hypothetical protein n=1 Tax=Haloferula sp. TaxID=2497595 RepID=UPI00329DF7BA
MAASVLALPNPAILIDYKSQWPCLVAIVRHLKSLSVELEPLAEKLKKPLRNIEMSPVLNGSEERAASMIGEVVGSALASFPSLCENDFREGRVHMIEGVRFSHMELAFLHVIGQEKSRV